MFERMIDNLSMKYDFLYILKNKFIFSILLLFLVLGSSWIIEANYKVDGGSAAIVKNILPFFVDISVIVIFTIALLAYRIIFNDETTRIVETEANSKINEFIFFPLQFSNENITFSFENDAEHFFKLHPIITTILTWTNFVKEDFFRVHAGSLDIPKLSILSIETSENKIHIRLGASSFYDIFFTHYFPDYNFTRESNQDHKDEKSLRSLFSKNIENHYKIQKNLPLKEFYNLLPNPLGITGIVELKCNSETFYILKRREKKSAAAKSKWQWSFAGTVDIAPKFLDKQINFVDFIHDELDDEVLKYDDLKFLNTAPNTYMFLGIVINHLYLYQPEMFVKISYTLDSEQEKQLFKIKKQYDDQMSKFINNKTSLYKKQNCDEPYFLIKDARAIKQDLASKEINFRNLCQYGYNFLEQSQS